MLTPLNKQSLEEKQDPPPTLDIQLMVNASIIQLVQYAITHKVNYTPELSLVFRECRERTVAAILVPFGSMHISTLSASPWSVLESLPTFSKVKFEQRLRVNFTHISHWYLHRSGRNGASVTAKWEHVFTAEWKGNSE